MEKEYIYTIVREDFNTGKRAKRKRKYYSSTPKLKVGGLYVHLGKGYPGCQRVIDVEERPYPFND